MSKTVKLEKLEIRIIRFEGKISKEEERKEEESENFPNPEDYDTKPNKDALGTLEENIDEDGNINP